MRRRRGRRNKNDRPKIIKSPKSDSLLIFIVF